MEGAVKAPFFMINGERQVSPSISGIRADHVYRYSWAAQRIKGSVIDAACGVGYGSWILANAGLHVRSIDIDSEAIEYAKKHYPHSNIFHQCYDLKDSILSSDPVVAFEIIEHIEDPLAVLKNCSDTLYCSVPNEAVFPYKNYAFHYRHYTKLQFEKLLNDAGYKVESWFGQAGDASQVKAKVEGRTLIAVAKR